MPRVPALVSCLLLLVFAGCQPAPRTQTEPRAPWAVGTDETLDIATWNIENYPLTFETADTVAELIDGLELDMVAAQEIGSESSFEVDLMGQLPGWEWVLSPHVYPRGEPQKVALMWREEVADLVGWELLFEQNTFSFPRPPLWVELDTAEGPLEVVVVHLKAGVGGDDRDRRRAAALVLDEWIETRRAEGGAERLVLLGDFNTTAADGDGLEPWLGGSSTLLLQTWEAERAGGESYLPYSRFIDHILTSRELDDGEATVTVPALQALVSQYRIHVSDHIPVVVQIPL